jgi:hypothetical protein
MLDLVDHLSCVVGGLVRSLSSWTVRVCFGALPEEVANDSIR